MATRLWDAVSKGPFFGSHNSSKTTDSTTSTAKHTTNATTMPDQGGKVGAIETDKRNVATSSSMGSYFDSSLYWNYANDSINYATESTYLTLASVLSPLYTADSSYSFFGNDGRKTNDPSGNASSSIQNGLSERSSPSSSLNQHHKRRGSSFLLRMANRQQQGLSSPEKDRRSSLRQQHGTTNNTLSSLNLVHNNTATLLWRGLTKNPYNVVRGRQPINHRRQAMSAVRSFLALVPVDEEGDDDNDEDDNLDKDNEEALLMDPQEEEALARLDAKLRAQQPPPSDPMPRTQSFTDAAGGANSVASARATSKDETASQLAEGTLRALRDLALEEALEMNASLRFWSQRWERPLLSWFEAGPWVWTSPMGYRHRRVGERVAQLQAVLARRCASIGELQEHLLRAGWQQGVAQWGVLEQWATVGGVDGSIVDDSFVSSSASSRPTSQRRLPSLVNKVERSRISVVESESSSASTAHTTDDTYKARGGLKPSSDHVGSGDLQSTAHVLVKRGHGEGLYTDDPFFLADWAVEAIALVRRHLYRASNGLITLPYETNWVSGKDDRKRALPAWITEVKLKTSHEMVNEDGKISERKEVGSYLKVTDLKLMMAEVSELLDVMEDIMAIQRQRRLDLLRFPNWFRRNWYIVATFGPLSFYLIYKGDVLSLVSKAIVSIRGFVKERLTEPFMAIIDEIWKGRESFSDKKARRDATNALKEMIRNWLDEVHPKMPEAERIALSEALDMSLIEQKKTESMRTFFEINNVIRMSFIEMQYMKREMMNALSAMDEVMAANDINMNLAAITPVILLAYANFRFFRFLSHAVFRIGRSREDTFADFRTILTDIERLLVMRDNPPIIRRHHHRQDEIVHASAVLNPDDLGMLMLLIFELRTILMRERRRFTNAELRGVSEDLAELAGERGIVSVRQQLQILSRMGRTYSFLKVISTGHMFHYSTLQLRRR